MSGDDDFLEEMQAELAAAREEQRRDQAAKQAAAASMRAAVQRIEEVAQQPVEAPPAEASERVEHATGVALPLSITLDRLPKVKLDTLIDPRRMMTQPSLRAVDGGGSLGPDPRAAAVVGGRTVGGNTGRFKDASDAVPPSSDGVDSHELPVPQAPARRPWWPVVLMVGAAAVAIALLAFRSPPAPDLARASTRPVSDAARAVAASGATEEKSSAATPAAPEAPSASPAAPPAPVPAAATGDTTSSKTNPPVPAAAPIPAKRLPFEPD